jgi:hypothetical protein
MNIQYLLQDNASHDIDVNEKNLDTGSHASDRQDIWLPDNTSGHSSHDNNSLERHIPVNRVAEHWRDRRIGEETEIEEGRRRGRRS